MYSQPARSLIAAGSQPEDGGRQGVGGHGEGAVKVMCKFLHHRMRRRVDENRSLEVVAEQHRFDRDVADDHGRNRQQDERQGDHPRCLVRLLTRRKTMVVRIMCVVGMVAVVFVVPV